MSERRILRVNALLHAALDQYLQRTVEFPQGVLATISQVLTSEDLSRARVFISVLPASQGAAVVKDINVRAGSMRHALGKQVSLRSVPQLRFVEDVREERADRINRLLDEADETR